MSAVSHCTRENDKFRKEIRIKKRTKARAENQRPSRALIFAATFLISQNHPEGLL
jgi:hypothetical protein